MCVAGFRVGAIDEMVTSNVPAEYMPAVTGHEAEELSKLIHYFRPSVSMMIPGLLPLYGWPSAARGSFAMSAQPADFTAVLASGADPDQVCALIDAVLHIRPHFSHPGLFKGGRLRPFAECMAASLVMHYPDMDKAGEAHAVTCHLRRSVHFAGVCNSPAAADLVLRSWSTLTRSAFDSANLHLTSQAHRVQSADVDAILHSVQSLHQVLFLDWYAIFRLFFEYSIFRLFLHTLPILSNRSSS